MQVFIKTILKTGKWSIFKFLKFSWDPTAMLDSFLPILLDLTTEEQKLKTKILLRKSSASQWAENCPVLFLAWNAFKSLQNFKPSSEVDGVKKLDPAKHLSSLGSKTKRFCSGSEGHLPEENCHLPVFGWQ